MRRYGLSFVLLVSLWSGSVLAQTARPPVPYTLNQQHALYKGLVLWVQTLPYWRGGTSWLPLVGSVVGTLTNMGTGFGSGSGWQSSSVASWPYELACAGTDDVVNFGITSTFDFVNTTFTLSGRFRTATAATQYIVGNRDEGVDTGGSYYLRVNSTGTLLAAIRGTTGNAATRPTLGTYADGLWHTFSVIYTTDTVTGGSNSITVYVDGKPDQDTLTFAGATYAAPVTALGLCAASGNVAGSFLTGAVDNVMVHNRALSDAEVMQYHTMTHPTMGGLFVEQPVTVGFALPKRLFTQ